MRTISREHFVSAIETGIAASGLAPWKVERLREHGRTAEHTLVYSFKWVDRYDGTTYRCPIYEVGPRAIGDDGWLFVLAFDKAAAGCVVRAPERRHVVGPIKVVD
jgi:hypothetical protein